MISLVYPAGVSEMKKAEEKIGDFISFWTLHRRDQLSVEDGMLIAENDEFDLERFVSDLAAAINKKKKRKKR